MMPQRDIVIFLGAGFSFDAGLPIMSDFGPQSQIDFNTLKTHTLEGNKREAAEMLVHAAEIFYAFQDVCRLSSTLTPGDVENLETVFCIAEAMDEAGLKTIPLQEKDYPLDQLIEKIQMWLWKIYQQCPLDNKLRKTRGETYTDFFNILSPLLKRTTFISTNYDLIFEYLSWKKGFPCAYPFKNLSEDDIKTISVGNGSKHYVLKHDDPKTYSILCKLHGSVNFFEDLDSDNKLLITTDLGGDKSIGRSGSFRNKPAIFAVDAIFEIRKNYGQSLTPAIIPPTYAKLRGKKWLREIWNHALTSLSNANIILYIGYSMPPTDGFMRALIHAAFATRKQTNKPNIFVIDPNPQIHRNYYELFGDSYKDIGHHTLEWALQTNALENALAREIKKLS